MNLRDCKAIVPDYTNLIGKKIEYKKEIFKVLKVLIVPTTATKLNIFINSYYKEKKSADNALSHFMTSNDLTIVLESKKLSDESIAFIPPTDIIVLD